MENKTFFSEKTGKLLAIGGLSVIIVSISVFIIFGSWHFSSRLNEEKVGQFGDFISGIAGSIISLAGFILFYVALSEQRKDSITNRETLNLQIEALNLQVSEFKAQKEEMQETRKVYNEQTKEFKKQTEINKLQQFDSSFYSLLNVFIELKRELNKKDENGKYFHTIYSKLKLVEIHNAEIGKIYDRILTNYNEIFYNNSTELNHYFKTIYRIFKLIEESSISESYKLKFSKILRSQLTDDELLVLYYNYHSVFGEKVRTFVIKYTLFKHLQIIDRIEFGFEGTNETKAKLSAYLNSMSTLIKSNFLKFTDIAEESDINISESKKFIDFDSQITLQINTVFDLVISFDRTTWSSQNKITKEFIKQIISALIYDSLFLNKYKIPTGDEISIEHIESELNFKVRFTIQNIGNI
jgi:hypothetical protein